MKIKKLAACFLALSMTICYGTSVFAADRQNNKPALQKVDDIDDINSLLSGEVIGENEIIEDMVIK